MNIRQCFCTGCPECFHFVKWQCYQWWLRHFRLRITLLWCSSIRVTLPPRGTWDWSLVRWSLRGGRLVYSGMRSGWISHSFQRRSHSKEVTLAPWVSNTLDLWIECTDCFSRAIILIKSWTIKLSKFLENCKNHFRVLKPFGQPYGFYFSWFRPCMLLTRMTHTVDTNSHSPWLLKQSVARTLPYRTTKVSELLAFPFSIPMWNWISGSIHTYWFPSQPIQCLM